VNATDLRSEVGAERRSLWLRWGLFAAALLGLLSIATGGLFFYAATVVGLMLGMSTLLTSLSIRQLGVERKLSASQITCGEKVEAWLIVHNRKTLPASALLCRDQIEQGLDVEGPTSCFTSLRSDEKQRLAYHLHSTHRGLFRIGPAVVEAAGPFGLIRRFHLHREARFLTVLPKSVEMGKGWPLGHRPIHEVPRRRSLFEDPSRFQGIREYQRGDALKRVHWRATARSGTLQVKLFEPAVLEGALVAVEMGRGAYRSFAKTGEELNDGEELAVVAAASIARFVLGGGQAAGLISNGADAAERYPEDWSGDTFRRLEDVVEATATRRKISGFRPLEGLPGKGRWQLDHLMPLLARLIPAPGPNLPELLISELPRLPRSLVLMIVTPRVDPALAGAVDVLRRAGVEVGILWIASDSKGSAPSVQNAPIYAIRNEQDLESLGEQRL